MIVDMITGEDIGLGRMPTLNPWVLYDLVDKAVVQTYKHRPFINTQYREAFQAPGRSDGLWLRVTVHNSSTSFPDSVHEKDVPEVVRLAATLLE